jgi:membrane protein DedA with SNARE-associated domain
MPWRGFLLANAGGAVIWAAVFGVGGYLFGKVLLQLHGAVGPIAFVLATAVLLGGGFLMRRFEIRLSLPNGRYPAPWNPSSRPRDRRQKSSPH